MILSNYNYLFFICNYFFSILGKLPVEELLRHYMQSKSDSTFMSDVETDYSGSSGSGDEFSDNEEVGDDDLGLESLVNIDDEDEEVILRMYNLLLFPVYLHVDVSD